jgi:hypothetical protein
VDSKLFSLSGGFQKSGGFQSFILEFTACCSLPGGFQETYLLGLVLAYLFRASNCVNHYLDLRQYHPIIKKNRGNTATRA